MICVSGARHCERLFKEREGEREREREREGERKERRPTYLPIHQGKCDKGKNVRTIGSAEK